MPGRRPTSFSDVRVALCAFCIPQGRGPGEISDFSQDPPQAKWYARLLQPRETLAILRPLTIDTLTSPEGPPVIPHRRDFPGSA